MEDYDYMYKILLVGDSAVGKSSLIIQYIEGVFSETFISTIGVDFKIRTVTVHDKRHKLQIWDTAGQERFRTITSAYYRGAQGIFIVYDVTAPVTFENVSLWSSEILRNADRNRAPAVKMLVGNKIDCVDARAVTREAGERAADKFGMAYVEVSAKTGGPAIDSLFTTMAGAIYSAARTADLAAVAKTPQTSANSVLLDRANQPASSASCC